ncbi:MAG TPA: universal stress protein [Puia sp.]|jgi:nucleotide-binding universal stress UspA family protein|nr:universal stress protein [Puia sp.]
MKTMLIPVDFTETSENAINYAAEWCSEFDYDHIILHKTFYNSVFDNLIPSNEYANINEDYFPAYRKEEMEKLHELKENLNARLKPGIKVSLIVSELPMLRSIMNVLRSENVELIIVGSDHLQSSNNGFISTHVINIAKASPVRVLIVPSISAFNKIEQVLVPCDFNALQSLERLARYKENLPKRNKMELMVLNVDQKDKHLQKDSTGNESETLLHEYLKNFKHEIFYSNDKNIITGIVKFLKEHETDLIVALPGKHSFLYSLTHKSISESLYRNALKPVLILK